MKVLLGVTGGIAVYKACEVVRRLREKGHEVTVVMTETAQRFVTPMTFQVLSGRRVATRMFGEDDPSIDHIVLARWPDVIAVAPATAHSIARFAHGFADELLSTIVLAAQTSIPLVLAPAMNTVMWESPLVQRNLRLVQERGKVVIVPPVEKLLACGERGVGGLAGEDAIVAAITGSSR
jgi:phosphopantothenoylcysteine decarboxylase/phosphopantothenate--cysteine ligase